MNFKHIIFLTLCLCCSPIMQAQSNNDDDDNTVTITDEKGKQEIIDVPEALNSDLDSLLYLYNAKTYLKPDTNCNMPDVNPIYSKEVYEKRLQQLPTVIEMPYNEVVQKFIDRYSNNLRRSVSFMLGAQNFYMPVFEEALESYGLPLELKYLPVIESALNPRAVSRVGASGLWQFMITTAKRYKLKVNSLVDERRDVLKSSYAAAHYLSDLYNIYHDWNLVIAAYNAGPDKINRAIHRSKGNKDYWQIYPYLPQETRGYVPAFIAANYIMNYYCEHNICPMTCELPVATDTVMVYRDVHFEQVAHVLGIDIDQLRDLNPQYRRNVVNGNAAGGASLRLPVSQITNFIDLEDSVYAYNSDELLNKRTEVEPNDDVPMYKSSKSQRRHSSSRHSAKQSTNSNRKRGSKRKKRQQDEQQHVTIKGGDTLSEIAERNHTTVSKLKKLNKISGNNIRAGKKIRVK